MFNDPFEWKNPPWTVLERAVLHDTEVKVEVLEESTSELLFSLRFKTSFTERNYIPQMFCRGASAFYSIKPVAFFRQHP